jgi:hypothetical protein
MKKFRGIFSYWGRNLEVFDRLLANYASKSGGKTQSWIYNNTGDHAAKVYDWEQ